MADVPWQSFLCIVNKFKLSETLLPIRSALIYVFPSYFSVLLELQNGKYSLKGFNHKSVIKWSVGVCINISTVSTHVPLMIQTSPGCLLSLSGAIEKEPIDNNLKI